MRVHLGGHLSWYDPQRRSWLELSPTARLPLLDLATQLGLPPSEIALAAINGEHVDLSTAVADVGDNVEFYPALGGG
jgi:hypothetical protein